MANRCLSVRHCMELFDTVLFECSEKFAQSINWNGFIVPSKVIELIKDNNAFNTNSLENCKTAYLISLEGNLKSQHFEEYEYVNADDVPMKMAIKKKGEYWMDEDFNGEITISPDGYVYFSDQDWHLQFKLVFESGLLVSTTCVDCESVVNSKKRQEEKELAYNKFIRFYLKFWLKPIDLYLNKIGFKYQSWVPFLRAVRYVIIPFYSYF